MVKNVEISEVKIIQGDEAQVNNLLQNGWCLIDTYTRIADYGRLNDCTLCYVLGLKSVSSDQ